MMFVLDDLVVRKYMYVIGEQIFGISWMLFSDNGFEMLKQVIVYEKYVNVLKKMGVFVVIKYIMLEDVENWVVNSGEF